MYYSKLLTLTFFVILTLKSFGQKTKTFTVGHPFSVTVPEYMDKTLGLNRSASIQFNNKIKNVAGYIVQESKEDLKLNEMNFSSTKEYFDYYTKDYAKDADNRTVSTINAFKKGDNNYMEVDISYIDTSSKTAFNDYICVVETKDYFYRIICWSAAEEKDIYKNDFRKLSLSLID